MLRLRRRPIYVAAVEYDGELYIMADTASDFEQAKEMVDYWCKEEGLPFYCQWTMEPSERVLTGRSPGGVLRASIRKFDLAD